jgi:hypothetical protein
MWVTVSKGIPSAENLSTCIAQAFENDRTLNTCGLSYRPVFTGREDFTLSHSPF